MMLKENLIIIQEEIDKACTIARRDSQGVTLLAVSKTKTVEQIQELYDIGIRDFGENQVQELLRKYEILPKDIRWHMIGHLQTNKVKYIASFIYCIHSVESTKLAKVINKEAKKHNRQIPVLVEINIANEESKFGIKPQDTADFVDNLIELENIKIKGLMTVAPFVKNDEENRKLFKEMYKLYVDISAKTSDNVDISVLSMGMSNDYKIAIEEGATIVRIGSSLFGSRLTNDNI